MPWLDPSRHESDEDRALRSELRGLLGLSDGPLLTADPTPEQVALAESLRQEAERRRRVRPLRQTPRWLLAAAALPFLLGALGLGAWGMVQKKRADALARDLERQRREHEAHLLALRQEMMRSASDAKALPTLQTAQRSRPSATPRGRELVIPVDRAPVPDLQGTVTVKDRR